MVPKLDLPFTTSNGQSLSFDLYRPNSDAPVPLVVCIHGGGWISGDKSMMAEVAVNLVAEGYAVACPQYRLAPLNPYPAAVQDVQAFVRHMRSNASEFGVIPDRIAALGNSAGGHLAAMLGLTDAAIDGVSSRVDAVVDICGITDLTNPVDQHLPISFGFLEQFMGGPFSGNEEKWREASPITYVNEDAPPFLIIHGESDDVVPIAQSEALAGKLFTAGREVEFHRLPGEGHSFTFAAWVRIERLFNEFLAKSIKQEFVA
jgi:acetyl esterase/lipase